MLSPRCRIFVAALGLAPLRAPRNEPERDTVEGLGLEPPEAPTGT